MASLGRKPGAAALTSADIPDNSITAAKIVEGTITVGDIGTNAVGADELADDAVDTAAIADGAVDTARLAADAVDGTKIADNAIDSEHYAADSIDAEHYAAGSVDATAIADDAVDSQHYAAGSIDNEHLADDAVGSDELANNVVIDTSGAITTTAVGGFTSVGIDDNSNALAITIDADENVGLSVVPDADWHSDCAALQIKNFAICAAGYDGRITANSVQTTSSAYTHMATGFATQYHMSTDYGSHHWKTAVSASAGAAVTWLERMTILNSGNVGIAKTDPQNTLHTVGTTRISAVDLNSHATGAQLEIRGGSLSSGNTDVDAFKALKLALNDGPEYGGQAQFSVGRWEESGSSARSTLVMSLGHGGLNSSSNADVDVMTLRSDGKVGIGTAAPASDLEVEGYTGITLADPANSSTHWGRIYHDSAGNSDVIFATSGGAGTESTKMVIAASGKVGIGNTAPTQALDVVGNIALTGGIHGPRWESYGIYGATTVSAQLTGGLWLITASHYGPSNVGVAAAWAIDTRVSDDFVVSQIISNNFTGTTPVIAAEGDSKVSIVFAAAGNSTTRRSVECISFSGSPSSAANIVSSVTYTST